MFSLLPTKKSKNVVESDTPITFLFYKKGN